MVKSLREIVEEVRNSGEARVLEKEEALRLQTEFSKEMSPVVERIRKQERQAYEEAKSFVLA